MRGFLAFRDAALRRTTCTCSRTPGVGAICRPAVEDRLTFEQTDALERLQVSRAAYIDALRKVFDVHGGDRAYTDVYLVRTEIGPLMAELSRRRIPSVASLPADRKPERRPGRPGVCDAWTGMDPVARRADDPGSGFLADQQQHQLQTQCRGVGNGRSPAAMVT